MLVTTKIGLLATLGSAGSMVLLAAFTYGLSMGTLVNSLAWQMNQHATLPKQSSVTTFDPNDPNIDPALARDFVLFVAKDAFDTNPATRDSSHKRACSWMKKEARDDIYTLFWRNPVMAPLCLVSESAESKTKTKSPKITVKLKGYYHHHGTLKDTHYPTSMTFEVVKNRNGFRVQDISYP